MRPLISGRYDYARPSCYGTVGDTRSCDIYARKECGIPARIVRTPSSDGSIRRTTPHWHHSQRCMQVRSCERTSISESMFVRRICRIDTRACRRAHDHSCVHDRSRILCSCPITLPSVRSSSKEAPFFIYTTTELHLYSLPWRCASGAVEVPGPLSTLRRVSERSGSLLLLGSRCSRRWLRRCPLPRGGRCL